MTLFSKEEVNTGRQWSFDAAKALAILFMVLVHTFIYVYGEENMVYGFQYRLNNIYGGMLGAPVFMFCMGAGVAYSRRTDAHVMLGRGLKLLVVGYLLNGVRSLPHLFLWLGGYGEDHHEAFFEELALFDIFQFAGMAFMLFALLRWFKASANAILLVGVALSVFGSFYRELDMNNTWLNLLCYPFVGIHSSVIWSNFPLANWFVFVSTGYWFGKLVRRCNDLDRLYAILVLGAGLFFAVSATYMVTHSLGMFTEVNDDFFYYLTPLDSLVCISGAITIAGIGHFLIPHEPHVVQNEVRQISTDVTRIYLIHWIFVSYLVGGLVSGILNLTFSQPVMFIVSLVILGISAWLARNEPFSRIKL